MTIFNKTQRKRIAGNIRKGLKAKFPGNGRNRHLAAILGVSPATVSRWAGGSATPGPEHLPGMAAELGIPLHRLCGYSGKQPVRTGNALFDGAVAMSMFIERLRRNAEAEKMEETRRFLLRLIPLLEDALAGICGPSGNGSTAAGGAGRQ